MDAETKAGVESVSVPRRGSSSSSSAWCAGWRAGIAARAPRVENRSSRCPLDIGPSEEPGSSTEEPVGPVSGLFGMVDKDLWGAVVSASSAHRVGGGAKGAGTGGKALFRDSGQALLSGALSRGAGSRASRSCDDFRGTTGCEASPSTSRLGDGAGAGSWLFVFPFRVVTMSAPVS